MRTLKLATKELDIVVARDVQIEADDVVVGSKNDVRSKISNFEKAPTFDLAASNVNGNTNNSSSSGKASTFNLSSGATQSSFDQSKYSGNYERLTTASATSTSATSNEEHNYEGSLFSEQGPILKKHFVAQPMAQLKIFTDEI